MWQVKACFDWFSFAEIDPLVELGARNSISTTSAAPYRRERDSSRRLLHQFQRAYDAGKDEGETLKPGRRTARALVSLFFWRVLMQLGIGFCEILVRFAGPHFLFEFLGWLAGYDKGQGVDAHPVWKGWLWGGLLLSMPYLYALTHHRMFLAGQMVGFHMRQMLIAAVHAKVLRMNTSHVAHITSGKVVNLISNDVRRCDDATPFFIHLIGGPVELIAAFILVDLKIGFLPAIAGLGVMMSIIPGQAFLSARVAAIRGKSANVSDKRINLLNQLISGAMVVKMFCWETPMIKKVEDFRLQEEKYIKWMSIVRGCNTALNLSVASLGAFSAFTVAWCQGKSFNLTEAFYVLIILTLPKLTMGLFFILAVEKGSELWVSIKRIDKFLSAAEPIPAQSKQNDVMDKGSINIIGSSFKWGVNPIPPGGRDHLRKNNSLKSNHSIQLPKWRKNSIKETATPVNNGLILKNITIDIKPGELIGIVGQVGSGKSSLLLALLGEMQFATDTECRGTKMHGRTSYVAQVPWVKAATFKDNILFGNHACDERYQAVLEACALLPDLDRLPYGDETMLGERGVNLSGGQKARLSLARAAYSDADIHLLDDPLSAVDPNVGRHLFEMCIGQNGLLKSSTRVLVTHQKQYLPSCDRVAVMRDGRIVAFDRWDCLEAEGFEEVIGAKLKRSESSMSIKSRTTSIGSDAILSDKRDTNMRSSDRLEKLVEAVDLIGRNQIVKSEGKETGDVSWFVYWEYIKHNGHIQCLIAFLLCLLSIGGFFASDWWLAEWAEAQDQDKTWWVLIYMGIVGSTIAFTIAFSLPAFVMFVGGSTKIHDLMLQCVMRAPLSFFHTNPTGRIINRFSKDQGLVDDLLPLVVMDVISILTFTFGSIVLVSIAAPLILPLVFFLGFFFVKLRKKYVKMSRELKRFEGITRSPIYATFSENLKGLASIRAFSAQEAFENTFLLNMDENGAWWYSFIISSRWIGFRLDVMSAILQTGAVVLSILLRNQVSPQLVALSLSRIMQLSGALQWAVRQTAELENIMTSVERMLEYTRLEQEPPRVSEGGKDPGSSWPSVGTITYTNVTASYRPGLKPVLQDISLAIPGGTSVGIVGRTGSGKSSLMLTLYRLIDLNKGEIQIDGVDTSQIGLDKLRGELAIIPQDPVLFSGSIRMNLDPWKLHTDKHLWEVLTLVQLKGVVQKLGGLDMEATNCGEELSTGERQLMCLARALVRDAAIIALDEATANVDRKTDAVIQKKLLEWMNMKRTAGLHVPSVLTIAHRIDTIMHCDLLVVLDDGCVVEFGPPSDLIAQMGSFSEMVRAAEATTIHHTPSLEDGL